MWPYYVLAFGIICLSMLDFVNVDRGLRRIFFYGLFFILVIFVGLRHEIGIDWSTYNEVFSAIKYQTKIHHHFEPGFLFLNFAFVRIGLDFSLLILFVAFLSLSLKFFSITKYSPLIFVPMLYYLAYYLTEYEMSGIRQSVAMSFAFLSLIYVYRRKLVPFLLTIFIGSLFHISILAFIPIFFLHKFVFSVRSYLILLLIGLLFLHIDLTGSIVRVVQLLPLGDFAKAKLNSYFQSQVYTGFTMGHIPYLFFSGIFLYYRRIVNDSFYNILLNGYLLGLIMSFIFSGSLGVLNRLTYYYLMTGGVLYSYVIVHTRFFYNRLTLFFLLSIFFVIKLHESVSDPGVREYYVPYKITSIIL